MEAWIGLAGVVVGAVITISAESLFRWGERGRRAKYLAVRCVIALDRYVTLCAGCLDPDPLEEDGPDVSYTMPPPPQLPEGVDWTAIPPDLCYRLLELPNNDQEARNQVSFYSHMTGSWDARDTRDERFTALGLSANRLATELRNKYRLVARPAATWNPVERLEESQREIEQHKKMRDAESAEEAPT